MSNSRSLTALHKSYTYNLEAIVSPALLKGQSVHHIFVVNKEDIYLSVSYISGFIRSSYMDKSSYDMFCYLHSNGKAFLDAFNIQYIDPKDVTLKPSLLKRK